MVALVKGLALLAAVLAVEYGMRRTSPPMLDWFAIHPNGGGV